jgi:hypothetical protein
MDGHSVTLLQERGETFRDRLIDGIVLRREPLPEFPQPWPSGNPLVIDYVTESPNVSMDDRSAPVLAGPSGH